MSLKVYRIRLNMNQAEMAAYLELSPSGYSFKENGKRKFTPEEMKKITDLIKDKIPEATMEAIFFTN